MGQLVSFHTRQGHYSSGLQLCLKSKDLGKKTKPAPNSVLDFGCFLVCWFFVGVVLVFFFFSGGGRVGGGGDWVFGCFVLFCFLIVALL